MVQSDFEQLGSCVTHLFDGLPVPLDLSELAQDQKLTNEVNLLLGQSASFVRGRIRGKIPGEPGREWHRDEDGNSSGADIIVVIAVTRLTVQNGTVEYLPKSHLAELDQSAANLAQIITPIQLELEPGFAWFHKVRLVHRTLGNTSNDTQVLAVLRFSPE